MALSRRAVWIIWSPAPDGSAAPGTVGLLPDVSVMSTMSALWNYKPLYTMYTGMAQVEIVLQMLFLHYFMDIFYLKFSLTSSSWIFLDFLFNSSMLSQQYTSVKLKTV